MPFPPRPGTSRSHGERISTQPPQHSTPRPPGRHRRAASPPGPRARGRLNGRAGQPAAGTSRSSRSPPSNRWGSSRPSRRAACRRWNDMRLQRCGPRATGLTHGPALEYTSGTATWHRAVATSCAPNRAGRRYIPGDLQHLSNLDRAPTRRTQERHGVDRQSVSRPWPRHHHLAHLPARRTELPERQAVAGRPGRAGQGRRACGASARTTWRV